MINIDNQDNTSLNEDTDVNSEDTTTVSEETAEETVIDEPEAESTEEVEAESIPEETEDIVEAPKKGAEARIRELNAKKKEAEAKAQSLEQKLAQLTSQDSTGIDINSIQQVQDDEPLIKPGEEIDATELDRRLKAREQKNNQQVLARVELINKQNQAITRINNEATESVRKYPELDPDNESFNPELSESVTEAVEAYVKSNPYSASVKGFVDKMMKPYKGAVAKEVGKASGTLAKQVSQAAQRPVSIRKTEKTAAEKSIAELEQELDFVQS